MSIITSHDITLVHDTAQDHIELIPMNDSHLPLLYEWNQNSEALYWCEGDDVVTHNPEQVNGMYGSISKKAYMFIITINGVALGDCWLQEMNLPKLMEKHPEKTVKRIDVTMYDDTYWGKGYGTWINHMLLEFSFDRCQADVIYAITEDYNLRAQKCITKSGFQLDEVLEHEQTSKGKFEYCYLMDKRMFDSSVNSSN